MPQTAQQHIVMVVDDDQGIREAIADLLGDEGYSVVSARDGQDALDQLRSGIIPCLIFLDLMMPVMDGWEFRRIQSGDPNFARIPVAIITAGAPRKEPPPADAFLPKPLTAESLLTALQQYC